MVKRNKPQMGICRKCRNVRVLQGGLCRDCRDGNSSPPPTSSPPPSPPRGGE